MDLVLPEFGELRSLFEGGDYERVAMFAADVLRLRVSQGNSGQAELVAIACAILDRDEQAEAILQLLVALMPQETRHQKNLAVVWLRAGRYREAGAALMRCLKHSPNDSEIAFNLGLALFGESKYLEAISALRRSLSLYPGNAVARLYWARCELEMGNQTIAREIVEGVNFDDVRTIRERYELSRLHTGLDEGMKAEHVLQQLLVDFPEEEPAKINLANLLERANRIDAAQQWLDRVRGKERTSAYFLISQAKLCASRKEYLSVLPLLDSALVEAEEALRAPVLSSVLSEIAFGQGYALDKLGQYEKAHQAFANANILSRDSYRQFHPAPSESVPFTNIDHWELDEIVLKMAKDQAGLDLSNGMPDSPIFLVGFPRSGTTLLDQILDSHPDLAVLEEKPAVRAIIHEIDKMPAGYPTALAAMGSETVTQMRSIYWDTVAKYLTLKPGVRLVDKFPLNLAHAHLITALFPNAKWIFAIRHPCDVVLSCFMQNFRFTDNTHGFWSIGQAASIYEQGMRVWLDQRVRLNLDCLDLRYEDLIADFEPNTRRLIDFLGLPWDPGVLRYNEHARTRRISTPSYNQVVEPIYKTAAGRWRNYEQWFEGVLPMLKPFIVELGYSK